jgi:hypothetical protein
LPKWYGEELTTVAITLELLLLEPAKGEALPAVNCQRLLRTLGKRHCHERTPPKPLCVAARLLHKGLASRRMPISELGFPCKITIFRVEPRGFEPLTSAVQRPGRSLAQYQPVRGYTLKCGVTALIVHPRFAECRGVLLGLVSKLVSTFAIEHPTLLRNASHYPGC